MSTRGSVQFFSIGSYPKHTEFMWHLYDECREHTMTRSVSFHLEIVCFSYTVLNVRLPKRLVRWWLR